jgi:hypothetical protein
MRGLILALIVASGLSAQDWSTEDTKREVAFQMLLLVDWKQTSEIHRTISKETGKYLLESNEILGERPPQRRINQYFATCAVGHLVVSRLLHGKYRIAWQHATITLEGFVVVGNASAGIRIKW